MLVACHSFGMRIFIYKVPLSTIASFSTRCAFFFTFLRHPHTLIFLNDNLTRAICLLSLVQLKHTCQHIHKLDIYVTSSRILRKSILIVCQTRMEFHSLELGEKVGGGACCWVVLYNNFKNKGLDQYYADKKYKKYTLCCELDNQ